VPSLGDREHTRARGRSDRLQGAARTLTHAEQSLRKHLEWVFTRRSPARSAARGSLRGKKRSYGRSGLSMTCCRGVCDLIYPFTRPAERAHQSSVALLAAAAARRNLIQAMIEHATEEKLGFDGCRRSGACTRRCLRSSRFTASKGKFGASSRRTRSQRMPPRKSGRPLTAS